MLNIETSINAAIPETPVAMPFQSMTKQQQDADFHDYRVNTYYYQHRVKYQDK